MKIVSNLIDSFMFLILRVDGIHAAEISCLVPRQSGEKFPDDPTKYFLDALLEFMVAKVGRLVSGRLLVVESCILQCNFLKWRNPDENMSSFSYLWDLFKQHYLNRIFPDFNFETNVYNPIFGNFI